MNKRITQVLKVNFEMHVALFHEEKKQSKCSKFNHSYFLMEDFDRLIDAVHEGGKPTYQSMMCL